MLAGQENNNMKLSRSQQAVLNAIKRQGIRMLPKDAILGDDLCSVPSIWVLGTKWSWSWEINQVAFTADYRKRITDLRRKGYSIVSFHVGDRHGYALIAEPPSQSLTSQMERQAEEERR